MKKIFQASMLLLFLSVPLARAQVIIYDDFSNPLVPNGTVSSSGYATAAFGSSQVDLTGLSTTNGSTSGHLVAGTNLPGGTWIENGGSPNDGFAIEVSHSLTLAAGGTVSSFAEVGYHKAEASLSLGSYNTSPTLTISAYISPTTGESGYFDNDGVPDGALLGFNSTVSGASGHPVGLLLDGEGELTLDAGGSVHNGGSGPTTTVAYSGGTFNPRDAYLLSYTINTTTGAITSISLEGSTANYSSLETASVGDFVSSAVKNVDLGTEDVDTSNGQGGGYIGGDFADLTVSTVPEPSTWALFGIGALVLGFSATRRQQIS